MSNPTRSPEFYGENIPPGFFGPDNPIIDGQRWARYPRGFRFSGPHNTSLFDGAPPLNPMTGKPWESCVLSAPRGRQSTQGAPTFNTGVGCEVELTVGDAGGGEQFRRFLVGPGTPVALRLGQYQSCSVAVSQLSVTLGNEMNVPVRLAWVDHMPSQPDIGILRAAPQAFTAAAGFTAVPDGAVELLIGDVGGGPGVTDVTFEVDVGPAGPGVANRIRLSNVASGSIIRTLGMSFSVSNDCVGQFFLAGV